MPAVPGDERRPHYAGQDSVCHRGGIGLAVATRLAQEGADVLCIDLDGDLVGALAAALTGAGHSAKAVGADVTDEAPVQRMADVARDWTGRITARLPMRAA